MRKHYLHLGYLITLACVVGASCRRSYNIKFALESKINNYNVAWRLAPKIKELAK